MSSRSSQVRIGVAGCGVIAYWAHLRVIRGIRGARLVAAADPEPAARERAHRLTGLPVYDRVQDLFDHDGIDAVVICAPTQLHAELAILACASRKHFYLEKPVATTADEGRRVIQAAEAAGVIAAMGFNRRFHPLYEQARNVIASGQIGRVRKVQTVFSEPVDIGAMPAWKKLRVTGGGVLLDLASHHIDLLRWLLDDEVSGAEAEITSELSEQDSARVRFSMFNGVVVDSFFSFRAARTDYLEFIGERGTLRVDRHRPHLSLRVSRSLGYGVKSEWLTPSTALVDWWLRRCVHPSSDPSYKRSLTSFVESVSGRPQELRTLTDGVRCLEAVLMAEGTADRVAAVSAFRT